MGPSLVISPPPRGGDRDHPGLEKIASVLPDRSTASIARNFPSLKGWG